jgi:hypothetical protein
MYVVTSDSPLGVRWISKSYHLRIMPRNQLITITLFIKQNSPWEADSQQCVQEMQYIIWNLKIVTVLVISDHEWAKNEISVTAVWHGFAQLTVSQTISKSVKYHQLSWTMCLWLNTSINVINVVITVSIVSPLNTVYTAVSGHSTYSASSFRCNAICH